MIGNVLNGVVLHIDRNETLKNNKVHKHAPYCLDNVLAVKAMVTLLASAVLLPTAPKA